jgi:hypothetical protein
MVVSRVCSHEDLRCQATCCDIWLLSSEWVVIPKVSVFEAGAYRRLKSSVV